MNNPFPYFRYHPDPLSSGSIQPSTDACLCCGLARGYLYVDSVYTCHDLPTGQLCPWCIHDGTAAARYDLSFSDDDPLIEAGVSKAIINEVCKRTPGYSSWQQERWLSCCDDACAFCGDASLEEIVALGADTLAKIFVDYEWPKDTWQHLIDHYEPSGNPAIYRFECLHCGQLHYDVDFT
jgi:uncharacterized protein CbrC (UPF0167 family)